MDKQIKSINRREFFSFLTIGWVFFVASIGGILSLLFRFSYPNVNFEPEMEINIGRPENFNEGVDETFKMTSGIWIVKQDGILFALSNICTHLGCIPNWTPTSQTFECPCHGSGYYTSGINFKGPAPRPLERYKISLNARGEMIVDKTKVFRSEKGQWSHPLSRIEV
jgi:cytochrome b6-f complex iron-sulfur subunit